MKHLIKLLILTIMIISATSLSKFRSIGHYDFLPNKAVVIKNPLLWKISASCHVHVADESDDLHGKMLKGSGTLDGKDVSKDIILSVKNGDTLTITATALAQVEITNKGENIVSVDCALGYETLEELEYIEQVLSGEERINFLE